MCQEIGSLEHVFCGLMMMSWQCSIELVGGKYEGDPKVQFHKNELINSKLFVVIDIVESLSTILKRSLTRLFYSLNLQSVISLKI